MTVREITRGSAVARSVDSEGEALSCDSLDGLVERRGAEIVTPTGFCSSGSDAGAQMPASAHDPVGVGLAVFSFSAQVLYLDRPARRFLKRINLSEKGYVTDGALPLILTELYDELLRVVCDRTKAQCWACVVVKRVIPMQGFQMVLRGVGLPDRHGIERARIVLAMQEIDPCIEIPLAHRAEQEHLPDCPLSDRDH